jgi:hypothetical protein
MQSFIHFVTEFPQPAPSSQQPHTFPRFGVWEAGGDHPQPEIVATGDNLTELCQFYGIDPRLAVLATPEVAAQGND